MQTHRGWAFLACRLLALYFGFLYLQQFITLPFPYMQDDGISIISYIAITWTLSFIAVVIILWFGANWLSTKLVPDNFETTELSTFNIESALSLVIALLGLLLMVNAFPNIITAIIINYEPNRSLSLGTLIDPLVKIAIGIFFVFKAKGIAQFLKLK